MKKGYTLIEMLVVLILIGVVLVIAIPNTIKLIRNQNSEEYNAHMKLVDSASKRFQLMYRGSFKDYHNATCFQINYKDLLDEDLLEEDIIKCSGIIIYTKQKNGYKVEPKLRCVGKDDIVYSNNQTTSTCTSIVR